MYPLKRGIIRGVAVRLGCAAVIALLLLSGATLVSAAEATPSTTATERLQLWHDIPVKDRRLVLDEYAAWLRLNGMNVAGPSNESSLPIAVTCSLDGDDDDSCESPVAIVTRSASEYSILLQYPRRVMFGEMATAPTELQKTLDAWLKDGGIELKKKFGSPENWQLFVLTMHLLYETIVNPAKSLWLPWLRTLPSLKWVKEHHGIFATEDETACLDVQSKRSQRAMQRDVKTVKGFVSSFCRFVNLASIAGELHPGTDISKVEIKEGTGCAFSDDDVKWAYAVITSRHHQVSARMSMAALPLIDNFEYQVEANVRPGVLTWVDRAGTAVPREELQYRQRDSVMVSGVELLASKDLAAGDVLTFRTRYVEPSDALLTLGRFKESDFSNGAQTWIQWDSEDATMNRNNCSTSPDSLRMMRDGDVTDALLRCAELHVLRGDTAEATLELRAMHDYNSHPVRIGAFDFLISHADLALDSLPNSIKLPHCFSRRTPRLIAIEQQNAVIRNMFEEFRTKIAGKKEQRKFLQDSMTKAMRDNIKSIKAEQEGVAKARLEWIAAGNDPEEFDKTNPMPTVPEDLREIALMIEQEEKAALAGSGEAEGSTKSAELGQADEVRVEDL